jgi:putative heme-binding domain-containing protein
MQVAIQSSLGRGAGEVLRLLLADNQARRQAGVRQLIGRLARQIGKHPAAGDVASLLVAVRSLAEDEPQLLAQLTRELAPAAGSPLQRQLELASGGRSSQALAQLLKEARSAAADAGGEPVRRAEAIRLLRLSDYSAFAALAAELLDADQPSQVQAAVLDTLAAWPDPQIADLVISKWQGMTPALRARAGELLFSRDAWLPALLQAMQRDQISPADVDPWRLRLLATHETPSLREAARRLLAAGSNRQRAEVVQAYRHVLAKRGDAARGKLVFEKSCAACHRLEGRGHPIGPNLAAMRSRGREAILVNVLDPNREVNPQYLNYAVRTRDGVAHSGMIVSENAVSLQLQRSEAQVETILRSEVQQLRSTGLSLMPEGLEKQLPPQAMADLLQYLAPLTPD